MSGFGWLRSQKLQSGGVLPSTEYSSTIGVMYVGGLALICVNLVYVGFASGNWHLPVRFRAYENQAGNDGIMAKGGNVDYY